MSNYMDPFNAFMLAVLAGMLCGMLDGLIRSRVAVKQLKDSEPLYANLSKVVSEFATIRSTLLAMIGYIVIFSLQFDLLVAVISASIGGIISLEWRRWTINKAIADDSKPAADGWILALAYMIECLGHGKVKPSLYGMALAQTIIQIGVSVAAAYTVALLTTVGAVGIIALLLDAVLVPVAFAFGFTVALTVVFLMPDSGIRNL